MLRCGQTEARIRSARGSYIRFDSAREVPFQGKWGAPFLYPCNGLFVQRPDIGGDAIYSSDVDKVSMYAAHSRGKSCFFLELHVLQQGTTLFLTDFPPRAMGTM